jgi:hypothetical protein
MSRRMRFTAGQQSQIVAGAVSSGRIPAAKAPRYAAEIAAGGTRGSAAIAALLAMYGTGRPIGAASPGIAAASRASDEAIWRELFGDDPGPLADPREAGRTGLGAPLTEREFAALYGDGQAPDAGGPPIPELAGYHPGVKMTAPADAPPPQLDLAAAPLPVAAGVQTAPQIGTLGIVEHGEIDGGAWHSHPHGHPGSEANGHDHEHVHQPGSGGSHAIGPGHSHDSPAEFTPDLASGGRRRRAAGPFTLTTGPGRRKVKASRVPAGVAAARVAAVVAAATASPAVRVQWPGG